MRIRSVCSVSNKSLACAGLIVAFYALAGNVCFAQRVVKEAEPIGDKFMPPATATEPDMEILSAQLEGLVEARLRALAETEGASLDSLEQVARVVSERFGSLIAPLKDRSISASKATNSNNSSSGQDLLNVVSTKGGVLAVIDRGDGVVHLFAVADNHGSNDLEPLETFALHVAITEAGPEVMLIDEARLSAFVGRRQQNAELDVVADSSNDGTRRLDEKLLAAQLEGLGDMEGVPFESLEETASEIHKLFQPMIASMEVGTFSPRDTAKFFDSSKKEDFLSVVTTKGGIITVIDRGDGVVHLLFLPAIDLENQNLNEGFALNLAITADGVEIMQIDDDLLTRFVGSGQANTQFAAAGIENNLTGNASSSIDIECPPALCNSSNCCCIVAGVVGKTGFVCLACVSAPTLKLDLTCSKIK